MGIHNNNVSVVYNDSVRDYPENPPYPPPELYPEYPLPSDTDKTNKIYGMVRQLLYQLGLDQDNFGSKNWNPFRKIIHPGETVVIKPNLCKHKHELGKKGVLATITHGSILRPIIDYVYIALEGEGQITVCDTSFEHTDFNEVLNISGIRELVHSLKGHYPIKLLDLREYTTTFHIGGEVTKRHLDGDPLGYLTIDLGESSEFAKLNSNSQNYHTLADHTVDHTNPFTEDLGITKKHHHKGKHEYRVSRTILSADALISVPKLKTHGKAGVTLSLKNMVGIASGKVYMPHHRPGSPPDGDAFPSPPPNSYVHNRLRRKKIGEIGFKVVRPILGERLTKSIADWVRRKILDTLWPADRSDIVEWGDWHGNDTLWRTILDLNKIALYCDKEGNLYKKPKRSFFTMTDGIIGQEGQGPSAGEPINTSLLIGGFNPVAVDTIAASTMGFDPNKIKSIYKASKANRFLGENDISKISVTCNTTTLPSYSFKPPKGWEGFIEKTKSPSEIDA